MDGKELRRLRDVVVTASAGQKPVACFHCGGQTFRWQKVALSSRLSSHFGVEAFDDGAILLNCFTCGFLLEFDENRLEMERAPSRMLRN